MLRPYFGFALVLLISFATACASGRSELTTGEQRPENVVGAVEIRNEASVIDTAIAATPIAVWATLETVFETLDIETPTVDARSLSLGNAGYRARRIEGRRMSTYLRCGNNIGRANADQYEVTLQLMVRLLEAPGGGTTVSTQIDAYARSQTASGTAIHCTSRGTLERRIVELVREELAGA